MNRPGWRLATAAPSAVLHLQPRYGWDVGVTRIGNDNWIMAYVHIAHDCQVGNNTTFANNSQLAGHVHIDDWAILGGFTGVHQFCRVGAHCMTAVGTVILQDVPPYIMAAGNAASPCKRTPKA